MAWGLFLRQAEPSPMYGPFMEMGGGDSLDVVTWHYCPTQSERGGVLPPLDPERIGTSPDDVPARAMAFIVYPDADAPACQ